MHCRNRKPLPPDPDQAALTRFTSGFGGAYGLPKTAVFVKLDIAAATGIIMLLMVITIIVMLLVIPLLLTGISVTYWDIASGFVYLNLMVLVIVLKFSNVISLIGSSGLLASLILVILTTADSYLLDKLEKADDWAQA